MRKLKYNDVKNYIESFEGYKLLSTEYKNARTKLKIMCLYGHTFEMTYASFQQGRRCPTCAKLKYGQSQKLTYTDVKDFIESVEGHKLLSKEYKNVRTKLKIMCPYGHEFEISYNSFQQGHRCPTCYNEIRGQHRKLAYADVKEFIESVGYKLLSKEYINSRTKLKIMCLYGHPFEMFYNVFKRGHRCPTCYGNKKLTNQEIIDELSFCENIRKNRNGSIEVTCKNCSEWFTPERCDLTRRIQYLNGNLNHEYRFYCCQSCKDSCPIYHKHWYPEGYAPVTNREVQPDLRKMRYKIDNYTCQRCGTHKYDLDVGLHCHHKYPLNEDPIQSADVDACITLCETCHKWIHQNVAGCGYGKMKCT